MIDLAADSNGVYVAGAGGGGNFEGVSPTGRQKWQGGTNGNVQAIAVVGGIVYVGGHMQFYCGPQHGQHTCTNPIARDKLLAVDETNGNLLSVGAGRRQRAGRVRPHRHGVDRQPPLGRRLPAHRKPRPAGVRHVR